MKARICYVTGYGWHVGRLLWWPVLLLSAVLGGFVASVLQSAAVVLSGLPLPYGLLFPLTILLLARRRLRDRLQGTKPFAYDPYFDDASELDLIWPDAGSRFRRLLYVEILMWGSIVAAAAHMPTVMAARQFFGR